MSIIDKLIKNKKILYLKPANQYTFWKAIGLFVIGLLLAGTIMIFYFIYLYSYLTLSNANTIIILSSNLAVDIIDVKTFQSTEGLIKLKKDLPDIPEKIRNIFYYIEPVTSTPAVISNNTSTINLASTTKNILLSNATDPKLKNTKIITQKK